MLLNMPMSGLDLEPVTIENRDFNRIVSLVNSQKSVNMSPGQIEEGQAKYDDRGVITRTLKKYQEEVESFALYQNHHTRHGNTRGLFIMKTLMEIKLRQFVPQLSINPSSHNRTEKGNRNNGHARSNLCKQGPRAGSCYGPSQTEKESAVYLPHIEGLGLKDNFFTVHGFDIESFNQPN